jgi:hypothetical protein
MLHGFGFFEEYPYLADDICKAKLSFGYRVPLPMQLIVKVYSFFRKICRR